MNIRILSLLLLGGITVSGCNKSVTPPTPEKKIIKEKGETVNNLPIKSVTIDATDYKNWVYFSFETGKIVQVTDPQTDKNWDLAFKRSFVKSNGGTSGSGMASAMETPFKTFKEAKIDYFKSLKDKFIIDSKLPVPTDPNQNGNIVYVDESYNKDLNKGIGLIYRQTNAPLITYSGFVYYFFSANGKAGMIKFTSYEKETDKAFALKGGYVSIEYQYPIDIEK